LRLAQAFNEEIFMFQLIKGTIAFFVAGLGIFGASTIATEVVEAPATTTTTAPPVTAPPFEAPFPDLSQVDWFGFWANVESERLKIEEDRRIARQMEVDEARMLYGICGEWHNMAISVGWPEEEWKHLSQIMQRESNCDPLAWSGSDAGLMQINRIHTEWASTMGWKWPDDLFIAENNLLFALRLWETSGWNPWSFSGPIPD
jgi:hypothetical protein